MTSKVWNRILSQAEKIENKFKQTGHVIEGLVDEYDWYNRIYTGDLYRRAHVEIVDRRESHKILILHCTIFAHYDDPSPIWGFDAVCGPNKITGAFHDMSDGGDSNHCAMVWFEEQSSKITWKKPRQLPDWAKEIFSSNIVAAGNVSSEEELDALCDLCDRSLDFYLENLGKHKVVGSDFYPIQSKYNRNNKLNPHVLRSMVSMGVPEEKIRKFIDEVLYPEFR